VLYKHFYVRKYTPTPTFPLQYYFSVFFENLLLLLENKNTYTSSRTKI